MPPEVLTGLGDLMGRSLLGLMTIGVGFCTVGALLALRSNRSTRDVVGGMGEASVGASVCRSVIFV